MNKQKNLIEQTKKHMRDKFVKTFISAFIFLAFATIINYVLNLMLARYLPGEHYGDFAIAYRVLIIAGYIIALGSNAAIKKFYPVYQKEKNWSYIKGLYSFYLKGLLVFSVFIFVFGGALLALSYFLTPDEETHAVMLSIFLAPLAGLATFFNGVLSGLRSKVSQYNIPRIANPFFIGIVFLIIISAAEISKVEHAIISCGIALLLICIAQATYISFKLPMKSVLAAEEEHEKIHWAKFSYPYIALFATTLLFNYSSLFLIEVLHYNEVTVGTFATILAVANFIWLTTSAVNTALSADIYYHIVRKEYKKLQKKVRLASSAALIINIIIAIGIGVFSKEILASFNPKFVIGESAFIIIIIADVIYAFSSTANIILRYGDLHKTSLYLTIFFLLANIVLTIPLIRYFDLTGAAISYLICASLLGLSQIILLKKHFNIRII